MFLRLWRGFRLALVRVDLEIDLGEVEDRAVRVVEQVGLGRDAGLQREGQATFTALNDATGRNSDGRRRLGAQFRKGREAKQGGESDKQASAATGLSLCGKACVLALRTCHCHDFPHVSDLQHGCRTATAPLTHIMKMLRGVYLDKHSPRSQLWQ